MKISKNLLLRFLLTASISCCLPIAGWAQSTGSITGTVTDKSGAVIPGATVVVSNQQTGVSRSVTTDSAGNYAVPSLQPGTYSVKASETGMQMVTVQNITLSVSSTLPVNVQLGVETQNQTVEVDAGVANIETSTMTVGQVIDQKTVQEVPLNGRHFVDLGVLLAGSVTAPQSGFLTAPLRGQGAASFNSAGGREDTVNFMINGVNLNDMSQNQITFQPTINTVSEFKADNSSFSAEMGRNSGTIVQIATRSGTNKFHGEGYDFIRNSAVDARNYFNRAPALRSPFKRNQFGGDIGGPIWRDHTFFFLSYEGLRQRQGLTINTTVPSDLQRAGVTDPVILKLLPLIPHANDSTGAQFLGSATAPVDIDQFTGDLAHTFSGADTLHFFYAWQQDKRIEPTLQGNSIPNFGDHRTAHRQIGTLVETHVFNPSLVNEARLGFNRIAISFAPQFTADQATYGINAGVTTPIGLPQMQVLGSGQLNLGGPSGFPQGRFDTTGVFSDTLNILRGKHSIKVGGEFRRFINDNFSGDTGLFRFNTLAAFLSDQASFFSVTPGNRPSRIFINALGAFAQDNYKFNSRLTLELGLRFDWNGTPHEAANRFVVFDPGTASLLQQGSHGLDSVYKQNYNVEPRLGFAYDVTGQGTTVLRGGYGLQADQPTANLVSGLASNPPFAFPVSSTATTSLSTAFTLQGAGLLSPASVQRNFRNAYVQTYNLNIQKELPKGVNLQVGYYGSKGTHLRLQRNLNQPVNGVKPYATLSTNSSIEPGAGLGTIADGESISYSNYNGLWVTATKNFSQGLEFNTTYQWTKSMDANSLSTQGFSLQDNNNVAGNYGPSDFDARNRLVLSGVYSLPFKQDIFVKGWRLSTILQLQSGNPFSILTSSNLNGTGVGVRPDILVPAGSIKTSRKLAANGNVQYLAPAICYTPTSGCEFASNGKHFGNSPRNVLYGPGFENFDVSVAKDTPIRDNVSFELRFDAFNALNHVNLGQPSTNIAIGTKGVSAGTFGQIGSTRTPTGDSGSSRQLQLAGKIIF